MNDNGEGPSTAPQWALPQHFLPSESVETTAIRSPVDTPLDDRSGMDNVPTTSDFEYDSHRSPTPEGDWPPSEYLSDCPEFEERPIGTGVDMGEAIAFSFPDNMEHDVHDEQHMLMMVLMERRVTTAMPAPITKRVDRVEEDVGSEDASDESYECSSEEEDLYGSDSEEVLNSAQNILQQPSAPEHPSSTMQADTPSRNATPVPAASSARTSGTLNQLLNLDLELNKQEKERDARRWKLLELHEALRNIEQEISEAEQSFQVLEATVVTKQTDRLATIVASGLSSELYNAYQDFCKSLHPEYGLRDGFSITCDEPHHGSYFRYDPTFSLFQKCVEIDYSTYNFRCEASVSPVRMGRSQTEAIVELWPIRKSRLLLEFMHSPLG